LLCAVIVAFPQLNSDDSQVAAVVDPVETPEVSAVPAEGESVDSRYRPSYGNILLMVEQFFARF
jgi:hypothetical protein